MTSAVITTLAKDEFLFLQFCKSFKFFRLNVNRKTELSERVQPKEFISILKETYVMRTHLECRATPTTRTTHSTSRALRTAMVIGHRSCSIFSPIPIAPARLMPLRGFRISKLRFTAMLVFCFMPFNATNSQPNTVLLLTGASNSSPRAVSCGCTFFFKVASIVSVCEKKKNVETIVLKVEK